jgi:hypothetical protein
MAAWQGAQAADPTKCGGDAADDEGSGDVEDAANAGREEGGGGAADAGGEGAKPFRAAQATTHTRSSAEKSRSHGLRRIGPALMARG